MRIGLFDTTLDLSVRVYIEGVTSAIRDTKLVRFGPADPLPAGVDLMWDPRLTGGTPPWRALLETAVPVVATLHDGASPLSLSPREYYPSLRDAVRGLWGVARRWAAWQRHWRGRCAALITVSRTALGEIRRNLRLGDEVILPIHHGVDHTIFRPGDPAGDPAGDVEPYFLHVSAYQPVKNLRRLLDAHASLAPRGRPRLVIVSPGCPDLPGAPDVEIRRRRHDRGELAELYRGALAFVFPSLHESFGLPIVEAMASGTPVVTSLAGACPEIAGGAAVLVDPRSAEAIAAALERLAGDPAERRRLAALGLERARRFTWERSAAHHRRVFEWAAGDRSGPPPSVCEESTDAV